MRVKRLFKTGVSMVMTLAIAAGLVINPVNLMKSDASASDTDKVFFKASAETTDSFVPDTVFENLSGNNLKLTTPADAYITSDGYLQINYKSSTTAGNDGSYTVWGEGGEGSGGDSSAMSFTVMATEEDWASQFTVSFYASGNNVATYKFTDWLALGNYTDADIQSAVGKFVTFTVPITQDGAGNYQGMKFKFDQGNSRGTLYVDSIVFSNGTVFDNFDGARSNSYTDADGNLPMYRPSTSLNGSYAGCNYATNMMWSVSTMQANIVNNNSSGERALQIDYDTNVKSYAVLSGSETISGEPVLALTIKGDTNANSAMTVKLMNGSTVAATLDISDFTTEIGGTTAASIGSGYATIYAALDSGISFDSVRFEFDGTDVTGQVFVKDIYFPRYKYTVEHYFDGTLDSSKNETYEGLKYGASMDGGYTDYSDSVYSVSDVAYSNASKTVISNSETIKVYYVSEVDYTINYYYDGVKDNTKTETGSDKLGTVVTWYSKDVPGYVFDSASASNITLTTGTNVIDVYYVKGLYGYTVNYYYDNQKDDDKTETGSAYYQETIPYTDKNITGYKFVEADPEYIVVEESEAFNIMNVYYVKDSFGYTINYYYDGVKDDTKTVTGTALYQSEVGYEHKNITGYKFDSATAEKITISEIADNNVINVYYVKDSFPYTINYYYDGVKDDTKTVTGTALYQSEVGYIDKNITGYKFDSASADKITIGVNAEDNVINVYYVKDSFGYTIEYYYDGVIDSSKTVTGTALYQSEIGFTHKNIAGFEFVSASPEKLTISEIAASNVIRVYYAKDSFGYTINYYYDGVKDDTKTINGSAVYQSEVGYEHKNITGYKFDSASAEKITISDDTSKNVIDVYYVKDSFGYTINYYYDNVKDDTKTVTGTALYQSEVGYEHKNITGYKFDSATAEKITISENADSNVINVYYVKDSFSYTINYYYDNVKDDTKTVTGTALYQSEVGYTDKNIEGYKFDSATAEKITISADAEDNVIDVYYVKDSFPYTINYYYDGVKDDSKTVTGTAVYQSEVGYTDKNITGYKFDSATADKITIGVNASENVINVYYVKDSFGYTINYYYDNVKDDTKTVTGTAVYQSEVGYTDKNITGYKFDSVSAEKIVISENASENVIDVYYVKDSFGYTINYYYDGIIDNSKTVTGTALYQSEVGYTDKNITGYKFDSATADKITIGVNADENVINVYYVKDSFGYTINYYYDNVKDDTKTVTGTALYQSEVGYTHKNIEGFKFVSATAEKITISAVAENNVIDVYYAKDTFGYTINYYYDGVKDDTKTDMGTAIYQSTVGYTDKNITGYKFVSATAEQITISDNAANNVINVYYEKDSFPYTISYYYDGVIDSSKTVSGTALYQSTVGYTDKNITGYKFVSATAEEITISEVAANNVINVYYEKDSFPYTIEYYYDGVIDNSKTVSGTAIYQSTVGYTDKNITGYMFVSASPEEITISEIAASNVIRVYYAKDSFPYTINYYYDGVKDDTKTINGTAVYQSEVGYADKNITGYKFDRVSAETITISEVAADNVIDVYYVKDSFPYTINYYYDGVKDDSKTVTGTAVYQSTVGYEDKNITGYKFDRVSAETITISEIASTNVIDVYYVKDSFPYTINYYYDGELDEEATVTGTAIYQSEVGYTDKNITGYKFDSVSAETIIICEDATKNVIDVYYVKDSFPYTINYYYDGELDEEATVTGTALYQSEVGYEDKNIPGYKFDTVSAETIIICEKEENNVINVYYVKDSFDYVINYYYDGVIDEELTEEGTAVYLSEVGYTDKVKEGFKLDKVDPEGGVISISYDVEENVINVYYVKYSVDYTIEYYYDGVIDSSLTVKGSGLYGDTITYEAQLKDGYYFVKATAEKITLGDDENIIKVYYEKIPAQPETGDSMTAAPMVAMLLSLMVMLGTCVVCVRRRRR